MGDYMNNKHLPSASSYHQIENYFFSSISQFSQHINEYVRVYVTGIEVDIFNFLLVTKGCVDISDALRSGIKFLEHTGLPFGIVFVEDEVQRVQQDIQQANLVIGGETTAMQLNMSEWHSEPVNHDIRCVDAVLQDWSIPLESAFASEEYNVIRQYQERHQMAIEAGKELKHYALYIDGNPVCSLTLSILDNMARLDDIGTVVEVQGKGYATALIKYALNEAKINGAVVCYLEASSVGASLYRRLGFTPLFDYQSFYRD